MGGRHLTKSLRQSPLNVAQPPVRTSRLQGCHPMAQGIQGNHNCDPDQIDSPQADPEPLGEVTVVRKELLGPEALRSTEQNRAPWIR